MKPIKQLDAKGLGEFDYDYKNDTLFFKIKDREYTQSIDFDDLVVDVDKEGFITGIQLFDASLLFKLPKLDLKNINHFEFDTKIEKNIIIVNLLFRFIRRNKELVERGENIVRPLTSPLADSEVLCSVSI
ncbi:MAG TPA: DUF2283 domain-containing protein [Candidatus Hodarchaeales archaeon]|nr:DUF2283 domain-containing protein [Candidatus Hodarchaeales archaeon]HLC84561.1 DUF2283 domain-containing protein [Candidatus Nanoarchaeia archaeon]